jgi:hypothetical protein
MLSFPCLLWNYYFYGKKFNNILYENNNTIHFNLLKHTGYGMHQQVKYFNNCTLCPHCIYVFCIGLRTNSDLCHLHKKLIAFYNRNEKCSQRGTAWVIK